MMMIDDVIALLRTPHDRNHVAADKLAHLLSLLAVQAFALVLDLAHADRHLGRPQTLDWYRLSNRIAWIGHGSAPFSSLNCAGETRPFGRLPPRQGIGLGALQITAGGNPPQAVSNKNCNNWRARIHETKYHVRLARLLDRTEIFDLVQIA